MRSRYVQNAKATGKILAMEAGLKLDTGVPLQAHWTFCPPDRRHRDDDNVYSALKAYRDGVFMATDANDRQIRRTIIDWGPVEKGGAVYLELTRMEDEHEGNS